MRWKMMELQSENGYRWNRTSVTFRHFCVCRRREMVIFREKSVHLVECCRNKANESSLQEKFLTLQYNYKRLQNEINLGGRVMRELFIGQVDLSNQIGRPATCAYWILIPTIPPPVCCESYGIRILMIQTGEREEVLDITVRPDRIESLAQILVGGGVTPCTLREVVEDWL